METFVCALCHVKRLAGVTYFVRSRFGHIPVCQVCVGSVLDAVKEGLELSGRVENALINERYLVNRYGVKKVAEMKEKHGQ